MAREPLTTDPRSAGIAFAKGHGTENDFVLVPDPDDRLRLTADDVRRLCDRHAGIGGDGLIRVVRRNAASDAETGVPAAADAVWFMDYHNADGSVAQMCGNGVRVFARYLQRLGYADGADLPVITRSGVKAVTFGRDGLISVDMGPARDLGRSTATVRTRGTSTTCRGRAVSMGNPHLACDLSDLEVRVADLDLTVPPAYDREAFPDGVNIEFYETAPNGDPGVDAHVRMRVHERGVGETRSCGTGICAVAHAALAGAGAVDGTVVVDVPGGRLLTTVSPGTVLLTGPAVIVAEGVTDLVGGDQPHPAPA